MLDLPPILLGGRFKLGGAADPTAVLNGVGLLTGATLSGSGFGLFDVTGPGNAFVISFLNANGITDAIGGKADIALTSSFNNFVMNPYDVMEGFSSGCSNGTAAPGAWCYQGTANLRGSTVVPEPSILGLMAAGLLGFSATARRRKA